MLKVFFTIYIAMVREIMIILKKPILIFKKFVTNVVSGG
jgi:hypothetical protein